MTDLNPLLIYNDYLYQIFHHGRQKLIFLNNIMDKESTYWLYKLISEPKRILFLFVGDEKTLIYFIRNEVT